MRRFVRLLRRGAAAAAGAVTAAVAAVLAVTGAIEGGGIVYCCLTIAATTAAVIGHETALRRSPALSAAHGKQVAAGVVLVGVLVLVVAGAAELAGPAVAALSGALAAAAVLRWARRRCRAPRVATALPVPSRPVGGVVLCTGVVGPTAAPSRKGLDRCPTAEVVQAWRHSFLLVVAAWDDPAQLELISDQRRACLDELARRDPVGFQRWIDSGARAAGDPSRYLIVDPTAGRHP